MSLTYESLLENNQFHQSVVYSYSPATNVYTFFIPSEFRQIRPVAIFSTLGVSSIPFDPELVCDAIADVISRTHPDEEYDIQ